MGENGESGLHGLDGKRWQWRQLFAFPGNPNHRPMQYDCLNMLAFLGHPCRRFHCHIFPTYSPVSIKIKALFLQALHAGRSKCRSSPGTGFLLETQQDLPFFPECLVSRPVSRIGHEHPLQHITPPPRSALRGTAGLNPSLQPTQA